MATANPATNMAVYERPGLAASATNAMTLQGTVIKISFMLAILLVTAVLAWSQTLSGTPAIGYGLMMVGLIGGFIIALVTTFMPRTSPITAPIYAALEGLALGAISAVFETMYSGLVLQAVGLSIGTLAVLLFVYATGIIRATENRVIIRNSHPIHP